jgi:predicted nuclease of predicted toxin-antitoxin system
VKFLVDAQLPPALAQWLREAGYDAQAVREVGLREADDGAIWRHAQAQGRVIVTKDEDFAQRAQTGAAGPVIVWLRIGNTSNAALRARLVPQLPELSRLIGQGYRLVEVR